MPTTGLFSVRLPVLPQKSWPNAKMPPSEATVRYPLCAPAGRWQVPSGLPPPTNPLSAASWWNWGHPPASPARSELEPATSKCCTMPCTSPPPMAKYPATVMPIDPSASAVTSGAFWNPKTAPGGTPAWPDPSSKWATSAPVWPSRISIPWVVGTITS